MTSFPWSPSKHADCVLDVWFCSSTSTDNLEMCRSVSWWDLFHHSFVKALGSSRGSQINGRIFHKLLPERQIYRKAGGGFFSVWRTELQTVQLEPFPFGFLLFSWWQSVLISDRDGSPIQHRFPLQVVQMIPGYWEKFHTFPSWIPACERFSIETRVPKYKNVSPKVDRDEEKHLSERRTLSFLLLKILLRTV